jgi:hypothetical protein
MTTATSVQAKNLTPFTSENAAEMGRRSAEARKAKKAAQVVLSDDTAVTLSRLTNTFQREALGPTAAALAQALIVAVAGGAIVVEGRYLPEMLRVLVDIARLEAGQATSMTVKLGDAGVMARLEELRDQATRAERGSLTDGDVSDRGGPNETNGV